MPFSDRVIRKHLFELLYLEINILTRTEKKLSGKLNSMSIELNVICLKKWLGSIVSAIDN